MGLTDEQVGAIIEEHTSVTDALKKQRDDFKEKAEKLPEVQQKLDDLQKDFDKYKEDSGKDNWEEKYNKEHEDFEKYKSDVANRETIAKTREAYKKLLAECNVGDKHIDSILRVTEFKDMKLKEDGSLDNVDALKEKIADDWSGFISSKETKGASVETPPAGHGSTEKPSRAAELAAKYRENLYGKEN
jgi:transketolase